MVVLPPGADRAGAERAALRSELWLRILLQNVLLIVVVVLFAGLAGVALIVPATAWVATAAYGCTGFAAALQWCHHGIRTRQIKQFLITLDGAASGLAGPNDWEAWLPANRPAAVLGSRWLISTKGVFVGLQTAMAVTACLIAPALQMVPAAVTAALIIATTWFLLTNPKE